MNRETLLRRVVLCALAVLVAGSANLLAQKAPVPSRVVETVDDTRTVRLQGNVHPLARAAYDQGVLADSQPMTRMLLLLQRSPEQELALQQLMDAQQTKGSGSYHSWVTPEEFGKQYGPSDADVQAVTDWLTRQGFQVAKVAAGRTVVEFSGNVAQVRNAFHTEIHRYVVNGEERFANVSDPAIPEALAPVVAGAVALHNFPKHAQLRRVGTFQKDLATGQVRPQFTYIDVNGTFYGVGPADFALIYNIPATAVCGGAVCDGSGQSIAVVGQSNINIQDVRDFRTMFGLPAKDPQIIVNGPDPGIGSGDEGESDLDVEWAGAVAPAAQIIFVTSQSTLSNPTQVSSGIDLSALYIIDNNLAPVMSESYGACEASLGTTGNAFYNAMWQQAAALGITVSIAAGDNGPAGCDPNTTVNPNAASQGIAVSGIASTPYNVAVGGTDFDQSTNLSNYWNSTNATPSQLSAKGYIAEIPWDDSTCAAISPTPTTCSSVDSSGGDISAGSGGPSNQYPKPSFQQGTITPNDNHRDLPDISLFASNGFNSSFYIVCQSDVNPNNAPCDLSTSPTSGTHNFSGVGGTSGGTPSFAGIMALVNQKTGERQGNANYVLYALAGTKETYSSCNSSSFTAPTTETIPSTCLFYDITKGNNSVACVAGYPNCSNSGSGYGLIVSGVGVDHGNPAFQSEPGYDLATGLGSINVANLLTNWGNVVRTATTTAVSSPSGGSTALTPFTATVKVTSGSGTPAGNVSLIALASDKSTVLGSFGPFTLASGSASVSGTLLPVNTADVEAIYGGDATHAVSTSVPVTLASTVAGAPYTAKTTVYFVPFSSTGIPGTPTISSQNIPYGSPYILQILVTPASGGANCAFSPPNTKPTFPCPTGTIQLFDGTSALKDFPNGATANATNTAKLNNLGIAEDQPISLSATVGTTTPGAHSITATYSGDSNYSVGAASNTLSVTISKAPPVGVAVASSLSSITPGTSVTFTAYVVTGSNGAGPTGQMAFTNGSTSIGSANCVPTTGAANTKPPDPSITAGTAYCTATLTAAISSLYPPPSNGPRTPGVPIAPILLALASLLLFALGWKWMPEPRRRAYAYAGLLAFALLAAGIAGCGGGGGGGGGGSLRTITATYPGDANYTGSNGQVQITVQ